MVLTKTKKRFISFALFFTVLFSSTFGIYFNKKQEAEAFALTFSIGSVIALVGATLVSAGLVWHNRNDIAEVGQRVYDDLIIPGIENLNNMIKVGTSIGGAKVIKFTKDGVDKVKDVLTKSKSSNTTVSSSLFKSFTAGSTGTVAMGTQVIFVKTGYHFFNTTYTFYSRSQGIIEKVMPYSCGVGFWAPDNIHEFRQKNASYPSHTNAFVIPGLPSDIKSISYKLNYEGTRSSSVPFDEGSICVNPPSISLKEWTGDISADVGVIVQPGTQVDANTGVNTDVWVPSIDGTIAKDDVIGDMTGELENVTDIPGVIPDTDIDTDIPIDPPINPSIPDVSDPTLPGDISLDFSPLYFSLSDKFPFCIPFDLINSIKGLTAKKEVPRWEVTFDKGLVGSGSFVIDMSKFQLLIDILRYFTLLSFVVTLIIKTKDLIS